MKLRRPLLIVIFLAIGILPVVYNACSDAKLYKGVLSVSSTAGIDVCTTPAQTIQTNLKYIFVIDHSGSNQRNFTPNPWNNTITNATVFSPEVPPYAAGTDIQGLKRFAPLSQFLQNIVDNNNTYYSVIDFNDTANLNLQWTSNGVRTTLAQAVTYVTGEQYAQGCPKVPGTGCPVDGGSTDYTATLDTIATMVKADIAAVEQQATLSGQPPVASDYVIMWVSDGAPWIIQNNQYALEPIGNAGIPGLNNGSGILGQISSLISLRNQFPDAVDNITLSTGFYHTFHPQDPGTGCINAPFPTTVPGSFFCEDAQASQYMQLMANTGGGVFIDFASNVIDYTRFTVPARVVKFQMQDIWLQNVNTVWWNGQLMADTDGDGIPDQVEIAMGSDPNKYDSDGNGVGDGVEYYRYGTPCGGITATTTNGVTTYSGQCSSATKRGTAGCTGSYPFGDYDNDGLNDCEEQILGSDYKNPDSNFDWVPDQFEWVNGVSFLAGTNNLTADPDADGVTNYFELKFNTPVNFDNSKIYGIPLLQYQAVQVSDNSTQTCYHVNVSNLVTMSNRDLIKVYFMESRGTVNSREYMRVAGKRFPNGNSVVFVDSDFR